MGSKSETGITDTGEQADPVNRKVRRTATGWTNDSRANIGDGTFRMDGTRSGQGRITSPRRRRGSR